MSYEYRRISSKQIATILAALRNLQRGMESWPLWAPPDHLREFFTAHEPLESHEIDKLCDEIAIPMAISTEALHALASHATPDEQTQPLPAMIKPKRSQEAYLHVQSLYGETVIADVVQNIKDGTKFSLTHDALKALSYGAAALELMKNPRALASKLAIERMMVTIYDLGECKMLRLHLPALEDANAALRAVTERNARRLCGFKD